MKHFEDNASIFFKDVSNDGSIRDYVTIGDFPNKREGMQIPGKASGATELNIKNIADEKKLRLKIIHEIGHLVGLYHMHQAANRDRFLKVNTRDVVQSKQDQYKVLTGIKYKIVGDYDFESLTHYSPLANGSGKTIIEILDPTNRQRYYDKLGTHDTLSDTDIKTLKQMYK